MSATQYIGARYVPIFADPIEWSSTKTYEPLTIVTHEGNSYTSKQFVPAGIDIGNENFWAETGNYNAQVEAYRREVLQFDGRINENAENIDKYAYPKNNPIYYGADPTGETDSADAINECITANKGGAVIFTPGVYTIKSPIITPYRDSDKVNIDFNMSIIEPKTAMTYCLGIGMVEGYSTDYSSTPSYIKNLIIRDESQLAEKGIFVVGSRLQNVNFQTILILNTQNGIEIGSYGKTNGSSDCQLNNIFIMLNRNMVNESYGIRFNSSDNKLSDARIYNAQTSIDCIKSGTHFIDNVHNLPTAINESNLEVLANGAFIKLSNGSSARLTNCYCDTYPVFVRVNASPDVYVDGCQYYTYSNDLPFMKFIECETDSLVRGVISDNEITPKNVSFKGFNSLYNKQEQMNPRSLITQNNIIYDISNKAKYRGDLLIRSNETCVWASNDLTMTNTEYAYICSIPMCSFRTDSSEKIIFDLTIPWALPRQLRCALIFRGHGEEVFAHIERLNYNTEANNLAFVIDQETFSYPVLHVYINPKEQTKYYTPIMIDMITQHQIATSSFMYNQQKETIVPTFILADDNTDHIIDL